MAKPKKIMADKKIDIKNIDLIIYDFDGVLTDNKVLVMEDGREAVFCNRSDGLAISKIKQIGTSQMIVSTEVNKVVEVRAKKLEIPVLQNVNNKKALVEKYCQEQNIDLNKVIYVGNDFNDLEVMKIVGFPVAPADATEEIKDIARIITKAKGGEGVIRELLDKFNI